MTKPWSLVLAVAVCMTALSGRAAAQTPTTVVTTQALSGPGVGGPSKEFYIPGRVIDLAVTLTADGVASDVTALRYRLILPSGFTYTGIGGANAPQLLPLGNTGTLDFLYIRVPSLPATFNVSILVPGNAKGNYTLAGRGNFGILGGAVQLGNTVLHVLKPDTVPPVIGLIGSSRLTVSCHGSVTDPGVTATDNAEGDLTASVVTTGTVDTNVPGTYTRNYTLTDGSGNIALARTRTIVVLNNCTASEGEGEGENICSLGCADQPKTDSDGDGLTDCQETCLFGTSPNFADSDLDGMDDKFEVLNGLDANKNDAALDLDGDGQTNLQEYLRGSKPGDENDPQLLFVVSALGDDSTGAGTRNSPWKSINFAVAQAATHASVADPARVIVIGGTYTETVNMADNVNVSGEPLVGPGGTINPVLIGSVVGADHADLSGLTIDGANAADVLLDARGAGDGGLDMAISNVIFKRGGTGILTDGLRGNETTIQSCKFNLLKVGAEIRGAIPALRRSQFGDLSAPAGEIATAVFVRATTLALPVDESLGDATDPTVGYNQFNINTIAGPAVINERDTVLKMEQNDWKSNDADTISAAISGPADFEPFLGSGRSVVAASIFCTVIDGVTQERITDASVLLTISSYPALTQNTSGVYGFPAVSDGSYSVTASATGYDPVTTSVFVRPGEIGGVVIPLGTPVVTPPAGGCNANNQQTAKLREQAGDLALAGMALAAMVAVGRFTRRRRAQ